MHEFDTYISSIVGSLKISKKKKIELAQEFLDHLELLKSEFINNGLKEEEAQQRAIERFGETNSLKKRLNDSISTFGNLGSVLFGVLITIIVIVFCYIPISGVFVAFNDFKPGTEIASFNFYTKQTIIQIFLFFIPFGYFVPIIFNRVRNLVQLAFVYSLLGIFIGICHNIVLTSTISFEYLPVFFIVGLVSGMTGYIILLIGNRFSTLLVNRNFRFLN